MFVFFKYQLVLDSKYLLVTPSLPGQGPIPQNYIFFQAHMFALPSLKSLTLLPCINP